MPPLETSGRRPSRSGQLDARGNTTTQRRGTGLRLGVRGPRLGCSQFGDVEIIEKDGRPCNARRVLPDVIQRATKTAFRISAGDVVRRAEFSSAAGNQETGASASIYGACKGLAQQNERSDRPATERLESWIARAT